MVSISFLCLGMLQTFARRHLLRSVMCDWLHNLADHDPRKCFKKQSRVTCIRISSPSLTIEATQFTEGIEFVERRAVRENYEH